MGINYELCKIVRTGIIQSGKEIKAIATETGVNSHRITLLMQKVIELTYEELMAFRNHLNVDLEFLDFMEEYDKKNNVFSHAIRRYRDHVSRYTVYALRCFGNGKMWIGVTSSLEARIRNHMSQLRTGRHPCKEMLEDYRKYGESEFKVFILAEGILREDRLVEESKYMDMYRTREPEFGYNLKHQKPKDCIERYLAEGLPPMPFQKDA